MQLVKEYIKFERGQDPKHSMNIGIQRDFWKYATSIFEISRFNFKILRISCNKWEMSITLSADIKDFSPLEKKINELGLNIFLKDPFCHVENMIEQVLIYKFKSKYVGLFSEEGKTLEESYHFERGRDPKEAMEIGLFSPKYFSTMQECVDFIISNLSGILKMQKIPDDIIYDLKNPDPDEIGSLYFREKYFKEIKEYFKKYVKTHIINDVCWHLFNDLEKKGYPKKIIKEYNNFERGQKPMEAMKTGMIEHWKKVRSALFQAKKDFVVDINGHISEDLNLVKTMPGSSLFHKGSPFTIGEIFNINEKGIMVRCYLIDIKDQNNIAYSVSVMYDVLENVFNLIGENLFIKESIYFERGQNPKSAMNIGIAELAKTWSIEKCYKYFYNKFLSKFGYLTKSKYEKGHKVIGIPLHYVEDEQLPQLKEEIKKWFEKEMPIFKFKNIDLAEERYQTQYPWYYLYFELKPEYDK